MNIIKHMNYCYELDAVPADHQLQEKPKRKDDKLNQCVIYLWGINLMMVILGLVLFPLVEPMTSYNGLVFMMMSIAYLVLIGLSHAISTSLSFYKLIMHIVMATFLIPFVLLSIYLSYS